MRTVDMKRSSGMHQRLATGLRRAALGLALLAPLAASAGTTVLYDGASGKFPNNTTLPIPWGLCSFAAGFPSCGTLPSGVTQQMIGGAVILNTSSGEDRYAGYLRVSPVTLNSTPPGIRLSFRVRLDSEFHLNDNRAGFSVIALDHQHKGIELGFWQDQIWAQNIVPGTPPTYFVHGETLAFDTTSGFADYDLVLSGGSYKLTASRAGTAKVLLGNLRDYSGGMVYPYSTNNFLFFGDDTSSASARVAIASISVTPVPEPESYALFAAGLGVVAALARRRRTARAE